MLDIVVCDDNERLLNSTCDMINRVLRTHNLKGRIVFKATSPESVEAFLKKSGTRANVFFLDIDFKSNYNTGYDLAQKIRETDRTSYIVFITGHLEYVLQAFKVKPFDFLPKPVTDEVLEQCLINIDKDYTALHTNKVEKTIELKSGPTIYHVKIKDIIYIEKMDTRTIVHSINGSIQCSETLENFERNLPEPSFIRCHKSFICNKDFIAEIRTKTSEIVFFNGLICLFGRKYKKKLIE